MCGHGGFSVIGGGKNVPQPVDLPEVEELKLGGKGLEALNIDAKKSVVATTNPKFEQANRLSARLDELLLKAAKTATAAPDAQALQDTAAEAGLDKAARKEIKDAAGKAQKAFQALSGFSGRQIAAAFVKGDDGIYDWNLADPVGKAVKDALDAQAELSELLGKTLNTLPPKAPAAARNALEEAMLQTDRRASELGTLVCEFAVLAVQAGNDPAVAARLDKTLESLIPSQSLKMHGSEKIGEEFRAALMPLAKRIDDLAARKERTFSSDEEAKIRCQIDEAYAALAKAEQTHGQLDQSLFKSARGLLVDLTKRLDKIRREVTLGSMRNFIDKTFGQPDLPLLQEKYRPFVKKLFPSLVKAIETQNLLRDAALGYLQRHDDKSIAKMESLGRELAQLSGDVEVDLKKIKTMQYGDRLLYNLAYEKHSDVQSLVNSLPSKERNACTPELIKDFCKMMGKMMENDGADTLSALTASYAGVGYVATQTAHLVQMYQNALGTAPSQFLTNKTLLAVFEGKLAVTTLVETRIAGLPDDAADPAFDDSNVVSSKRIGSGKVNTVFQVDFKDGSTRIFKPEAPGRQGLGYLNLAWGSYEDTLMVAQLNMASQRTADAFGLGDVMTKTTVGAHDGQFGIFMEKAPGREAANFTEDYQKEIPGGLTAEEIKKLPDEQYSKVVGDIMRLSNRLEWFDLLTGQADRHHHNYMMNVTTDGLVTHKGIDNDGCFGTFIIGPGKFLLSDDHASSFLTHLDEVSKKLYPRGVAKQQAQRLRNDPGIRRLQDGSIYIDTSEIKCPEIQYCLTRATGCHATRAPEFIDKEFYDKLMTMESGAAREKYLADLRTYLSDTQVEFAKRRLDGAIQLAKKLNENGCVITTDAWHQHDIQRIVAGTEPPPLPQVGGSDPAKNELAKKVQEYVRKHRISLFRRGLFAGIAKPGWF